MIEKLKELAESATKGPWFFKEYSIEGRVQRGVYCKDIIGPIIFDAHHSDEKYIAAANPATVLKLIKVVEAIQAMKAEQMKEQIWYCGIGCEFAEAVDEALADLEERDE